MKNHGIDRVLDVVVVGAGPASLAALHAAREAGLDAVAIDKGPVCSALASHPTYMRWFSSRDKLELAGFPLMSVEKNPTRQEYLQYCRSFARYFDLKVVTYREVTAIRPLDGRFRVDAKDLFGRLYQWHARNVVVATGFYDSPRSLNVPGQDLPKVTHRFTEVHGYAGHDVMVVGDGSSAAETALEVWRAGANVTVLMWGEKFNTKYWVEPDIENRIREGSIACYRNARLKEIRPDDVVLADSAGRTVVVPNDFVLAMIGYEPDTSLLREAGAEVDDATGKPRLSAAFETTVPGLYVVGTLSAGFEANVVFVENSREHAPLIVTDILQKAVR